MPYHFEEMSKPLQEFWSKQKKIGNVKDHSVCNICWVKLGSDNEV